MVFPDFVFQCVECEDVEHVRDRGFFQGGIQTVNILFGQAFTDYGYIDIGERFVRSFGTRAVKNNLFDFFVFCKQVMQYLHFIIGQSVWHDWKLFLFD